MHRGGKKRWQIEQGRKVHLRRILRRWKELPEDVRQIALDAADEAAPAIARDIIRGAIESRGYFSMPFIPCGSTYYYDRQKKFFYVFDRMLREKEVEVVLGERVEVKRRC